MFSVVRGVDGCEKMGARMIVSLSRKIGEANERFGAYFAFRSVICLSNVQGIQVEARDHCL